MLEYKPYVSAPELPVEKIEMPPAKLVLSFSCVFETGVADPTPILPALSNSICAAAGRDMPRRMVTKRIRGGGSTGSEKVSKLHGTRRGLVYPGYITAMPLLSAYATLLRHSSAQIRARETGLHIDNAFSIGDLRRTVQDFSLNVSVRGTPWKSKASRSWFSR